ncbi:hypothetical protein PV379_03890 [Streptomyces caniscabiei]|uniref:hypothetical protein n=1 Tax=Streptomyces caniscabiei TaxID=2746961 RepID=UPI0029B1BD77|nr:hypothetical protein [Streptomyces caniscabiei]MDX2776482.1 hypothetical protein [Streptomyces caniscabiei]
MRAIVSLDEARTTLRIRNLVEGVMADKGQELIAKELAEHGVVLTEDEMALAPWGQLLVCLRTGLFGRYHDLRDIAYLIRRHHETHGEALARLNEALGWRVKSLIDKRLARQRQELLTRLAVAMRCVQ